MTPPEAVGALQDLKILGIADLDRYKQAVDAGQPMGWGYFLPYLLTRNRDDRSAVLLGEDGASLTIFIWRVQDAVPRLDLLFPPLPMNPDVLERCFERMDEFNGDRSARILRVDARDADAVSENARLVVKPRRQQYIYSPELYADLGGRRFRTLRRQVTLFEESLSVEIAPYTAAHGSACRELLRRWRERHRETHGTAGGYGTTARALDLVGQMTEKDLRGEVVLIEGKLAAFALGGEIRPGLGCFFDAKSDPAIPGLAYAHRRSFLLNLADCALVNDGSDTGRAGLRQLKDSFRPTSMHTEYRASQRD